MQNGSAPATGTAQASTSLPPAPQFLVELEPRLPAFFRNLLDLFRARDRVKSSFSFLDLNSPRGAFWTDVFVATSLPWRHFAGSALYHAAAIAILFSLPRLLPPTIEHTPVRAFDSASVIYYSQDDYLPPLDTRPPHSEPVAQEGQPEYARQPIISVPPEPDNTRQTIVAPPQVKLEHDIEIPNLVAWTPRNVPVPIAATARNTSDLPLPALPAQVVAPAPEVSPTPPRTVPPLASAVVAPAPRIDHGATRNISGPTPAVIEPPPTVESTSARPLGDMNLGPAKVIAPAPQLTVAEQQTIPAALKEFATTPPAAVPPPPLIAAAESSSMAGRLIALGLHPAVMRAPIEPPSGNRRGKFAATPEGLPGAPGTPGVPAANSGQPVMPANPGPASHSATDVPSGLYVGTSQPAEPVSALATSSQPPQHAADPRLLANFTVPKLMPPRRPSQPADDLHASDLEKQVFGPRRFYSMTLNMPNLNSAGGSWVIRFAELKEDNSRGDLVAPVATQKVDPAYPAEMMRTRVEGTITLYAVIHSDGSVGDVRVLAGNDERLNRFAASALARWHFRPATKNGNTVALEAVVTIPFRAAPK